MGAQSNSLVPKFVNESNKYFKNHRKKKTGRISCCTFQVKECYFLSAIGRDTILKCCYNWQRNHPLSSHNYLPIIFVCFAVRQGLIDWLMGTYLNNTDFWTPAFRRKGSHDLTTVSIFFFFIWLGFTSWKAEQPLWSMELQKKRSAKKLKHTGNLFRKKPQFPIIDQRKAVYMQRIPVCSCARKNSCKRKNVYIDIPVTSRNSDRKIMQSISITRRPPSRIRKWNQLSQFGWTSTKVIPIGKT